MVQYSFPKFALKSVFTPGGIYLARARVCVCVHGCNLEVQMVLQYFFYRRIYIFLVTELKMAKKIINIF